MAVTATRLLDNYIDGEWTPAQAATGELDVLNPANGEVLARVPLSGASDLDVAVRAAREALPEWRAVSTIARARKLFDLRERLVARQEDMARSVTTEMGKTIADARAEVARMIEMVEAACAIPTTMQGRILEDVSRNIDAETIRQPVGVCAAIVPFNFPAMVPFWFLPFAIACGNTFVLKPSEQVPMTQQIAFEELHALGLPPGVVNLVNGGREVVEGDPRPPGDRRGVVRRVGAGGADRLRARGQGGQAGAGAGRRQEPHGGHARRRDRQDRGRDHRLGVRRRRAALHGRLGGRHRGRRARAASWSLGRGVMAVRTVGFVWLAAIVAATAFLPAATPDRSGDWVAFRMAPSNNAVIDGELRASWRVVTSGPISASPTLGGSTLYIGNNRGDLSAIDVRTGNVVWTRHLANALMSAPLLYRGKVIVGEGDEQSSGSAPDTMYVGMGPSALVALDAASGARVWHTAVAGSAMPTPAIVDGVLVEHNGAGWVAGIDPRTGKGLYARNLHSIASMTAALPVGNGRFVTIGVLSNAVWNLRASDGSPVWRTGFAASGSGHGDCPPVTDGTRVLCNYVAPAGGEAYTTVGNTAVQRAYALDVRTGAKLWDVPLQSGILPPRNEAAIPLLDGGLVYFGSSLAPYMHALDAATGRVVWQTKVRAPVKGGSVLVGGTLYFGDLAGYLWAANARTGAVLGCKKMPSGFNVASPIAVGNTLVIGSRTGSVYALPLDEIRNGRD